MAQNGKSALVMAGSRGLGFACARTLAQSGHSVWICSRGKSELEAAVAELVDAGLDVYGFQADVSDGNELDALMSAVLRDAGDIQTLVVNAGGPPPGPFDEISDDDWETACQLTLMSAIRAIRRVVPGMRRAGFGRIIVIGSSSVRRPIANLVTSNTLRPALNGLVKSLAVDFASEGITVNMVSPGRIDTERVQALDKRASLQNGQTYRETRAQSEGSIPLGRYGKPEELAALVGFLSSNEAAYITGQSVLVDGGAVATLP